MGLYDRLLSDDSDKIPVHQFYALMNEIHRGKISVSDVATFLSLSQEESNELQVLADQLKKLGNDKLDPTEIHDVLMLSEKKFPSYDHPDKVKVRFKTNK